MKNLKKTASILDKFLHVLSIILSIAAVSCLIGLGIIAVGILFRLDPAMIGNGYENADLGFVIFSVAPEAMPDYTIILGQAAAEIFLTFLCLIPGHFILKSIRNILAPMKNGEPFHNTVSENLSKLARYTCALGIGLNLLEIISNILLVKAYDLSSILLSNNILNVHFSYNFDLSFLFVAGILLLLSYVFRYGEELQQLSDETV